MPLLTKGWLKHFKTHMEQLLHFPPFLLFLIPFLIIAVVHSFFVPKQPETKEDEYRKLLHKIRDLIDKELRK